ncbi:MAG: response regulator transcription factor, partial [Chloroflexi bacterium]|nr:response regulator transcription factor [Chloroflexota bacterium]
MNTPIRALIIDADDIFRQGLIGALGAEGIVVAGEARDRAAATEIIARLRPDVIVWSIEARDLVEMQLVPCLISFPTVVRPPTAIPCTSSDRDAPNAD